MDRTKFYNKVTIGGIDEPDYLDRALGSFVLTHTPSYYRVDETDIARPDLISFANYRTTQYWWIICLVNKIQNPLTDFEVGDILTIPHLSDIFTFYKKFKIR